MRAAWLLVILVSCTRKGDIPPAGTSSFVIDTIEEAKDPKGQPGLWASPFVTSDGQLWVAYCEGGKGDARLAKRVGDGWVLSDVETAGPVGKYMRAAVGPKGPELVYLDQDRKTLRHARREADAWVFSDIASDKNEIGISGSFAISAKGERAVAYYNVRNQLQLTTAGPDNVWTTKVGATAGGVWQIQTDARFSAAGKLLVSFADWNVSTGKLMVGVGDGTSGFAKTLLIDQDDVAGLKSAWLDDEWVVYMSSRGGRLFAVRVAEGVEPKPQLLSLNVAGFAALKAKDGRWVIAIQSGKEEGLGEGIVELAVRTGDKWTRSLVDDKRSVGQYMGLAETPDGVVHLAYYDETRRALRHTTVK